MESYVRRSNLLTLAYKLLNIGIHSLIVAKIWLRNSTIIKVTSTGVQ